MGEHPHLLQGLRLRRVEARQALLETDDDVPRLHQEHAAQELAVRRIQHQARR